MLPKSSIIANPKMPYPEYFPVPLPHHSPYTTYEETSIHLRRGWLYRVA